MKMNMMVLMMLQKKDMPVMVGIRVVSVINMKMTAWLLKMNDTSVMMVMVMATKKEADNFEDGTHVYLHLFVPLHFVAATRCDVHAVPVAVLVVARILYCRCAASVAAAALAVDADASMLWQFLLEVVVVMVVTCSLRQSGWLPGHASFRGTSQRSG